MDPKQLERMAVAMERQAQAFEALTDAATRAVAALDRMQAEKDQRPARRQRPRVEPDAAPVEDVKLEGAQADVFEVLDRLSRVNATRTRKHVRPVLAAAVARAMEDFPDRDHLGVARDYAAWQEHSARAPHTDVTNGYRNQLRQAQAVRTGGATPTRRGLDSLMDQSRLEEAYR